VIDHLRPADWADITCQDRAEAAQLALVAFEIWLVSPSMADVLRHAREALRGFNLICFCRCGHHCHGDVLLKLVNQDEPELPKGDDA
jgi:hypothetical protein